MVGAEKAGSTNHVSDQWSSCEHGRNYSSCACRALDQPRALAVYSIALLAAAVAPSGASTQSLEYDEQADADLSPLPSWERARVRVNRNIKTILTWY